MDQEVIDGAFVQKLSVNINDDAGETEERLKSSRVLMVDQSTSSDLLPTESTNNGSELQNNSFDRKANHSKLIELVSNDRDIPDFLGECDDGELDIFRGKRSVVCSRSTQTRTSDISKEPNVLRTSELNHPTMILNPTTRQISTPNQSSHELMLVKSQLYNIHRNYQSLKIRFHKLHTDYWKLMGITEELTLSLENSARGQPADIQTILQACMKIYPDIFHQNIRDYSKMKSMVSECDMVYHHKTLKKSMLSTVPLSPKLLDFKKIKLHLINGNIKTKLLLLQALRWKITLSQPGERDEAILEYISNDLLGLHAQIACDSGKPILPYLLIPLDVVVPHPLQQSAARLLNTFASLKCGRDYLAVGPNVLNVVVQCLDSTHAESIDAFTCDMILATLQKLSLRKHQRLYMIAAGLVEWLIHHLKAECHSMGTYRLEYATALLMNLSLHKEAQIRAAVMATIVISTLIILLSLDHLAALPYINGALNNFLANSAINEEAKIIGLGSILEYHRQNRTGELRKHLDHILMRHRRKYNKSIEEDINDDDDREELDNLDDELDEMDPVKVHAGDLVGETLLSTCYSSQQHVVQIVNKNPNWSSPNISNDPTDEFNAVQLKEKIYNDNLPLHSRGLSARLTPIHCKLNFQNPIKLRSIVSAKKMERHPSSISILRLAMKQETILDESRSSLMTQTTNEINSLTNTSIMMLDGSFSSISLDKNYEEKVNSFRTSQTEDNEFLFTHYKKVKKSGTHSKALRSMSRSDSKHLKKESSMTTADLGITGTSTIASALEETEILEDRMSSIPSFDTDLGGVSDPVPGVNQSLVEEADAFASKPRLSRTPPQSGSSKKLLAAAHSTESNQDAPSIKK